MGDSLPTVTPSSDQPPPFSLTELDKWILAQTDEDFKKHDWENLKEVIEANDLAAFKRTPSDLRRYMQWTREIKASYGSMTSYILANRLPGVWGHPPFVPSSSVPFADPADYKVLINDWPYALEPDTTHLVVWTRTLIPTDPETGDVTPESRKLINGFVKRYFVEPLGQGGDERILWFKNWVALQSVRSLEHFHIMARNVDDDMLERWTGERRRAARDQ